MASSVNYSLIHRIRARAGVLAKSGNVADFKALKIALLWEGFDEAYLRSALRGVHLKWYYQGLIRKAVASGKRVFDA